MGRTLQISPASETEIQTSPAADAIESGPLPAESVVRTSFFAGSTIETVPSSMFGTQSSPLIHAEPSGFAPTSTRAVTAPVVGSTRKTRPVSLETHSESLDGVIQSTLASEIRFTTLLVLTLILSSLLPPRSATHSEPNAYTTPFGVAPALIVAVTLFFFGLMRRTVPSSSLVTHTLPAANVAP